MTLDDFLETIIEDPRITRTHISLYLVLFLQWNREDRPKELEISRKVLMEYAKINGRATYDQAMHELYDFGYIVYHPTRTRTSRVALKKL